MDNITAILGIVGAAGNELRGRTTLQKLAYLASARGLLDVKFKPHYYGPYSEEIASETSVLTSLDFLTERAVVLGPQMDGWLAQVSGDIKTYSYSLTPDGRQLVAKASKESPKEWKQLQDLVEACKRFVGLSPQALASAAKVHYILSQSSERNLTPSGVKETAAEFGWKLTEEQIDQVVLLLEKLRLVH